MGGCSKKEAAAAKAVEQSGSQTSPDAKPVTLKGVVWSYADHVHRAYVESHAAAVALQNAIEMFVSQPDATTFAAAKTAWLLARAAYSPTEAFRFYEGPIDAPAQADRPQGPEGRLNGWPLNEAYIDYVQGHPKAGIISDGLVPITAHLLQSKNAHDDEADVTLGYHAIEFLLWGQDLDPDGPGNRPVSDYVGDNPTVQRRREYLKVATQILVEDLRYLVSEWEPDAQNYRAQFVKDEKAALGKILTGIATLSGFELASERIAVAIDSASQEDEQSCFSDNTHNDHLGNMRGISDVYTRTGLDLFIARSNPQLEQHLAVNMGETLRQLQSVKPPMDRILAEPAGGEGRKQLETVVALLQQQAELLVEAGKGLGVEVTIAAE